MTVYGLCGSCACHCHVESFAVLCLFVLVCLCLFSFVCYGLTFGVLLGWCCLDWFVLGANFELVSF